MKTTALETLLACMLFAPFAAFPQGSTETASPDSEARIEEVVIEATRANLVKLAQQVRIAEFRFYDRYNELNTKREYAVNCRNEVRTGSRFTWDDCQPVFQDRAHEAEGRGFVEVLQSMSSTPRGEVAVAATPKAPASMAIAAGRPGFQQNMIDITRKNPDLMKLLNEYGALVKQYEENYRKLNGVRSQPDEKASAPAMPVQSPASASHP